MADGWVPHAPGQFPRPDVPYVAQFASVDLIDAIIHKRVPAADDPRWACSGARSVEEYALWSDAICGMACLAMILLAERGEAPPLIDLARRCTDYGGYTLRDGEIDGLYYAPFLAFAEAEFGLTGEIADPLRLDDIDRALEAGRWVIASVGSAIRYGRPEAARRGGHLVVVLGHDPREQMLFLHNPSGHTPESQAYARVPRAVFEAHFAGRGMLLSATHPATGPRRRD